MKISNNKLLLFSFLQFSVVIYTMAGVCGKYASSYDILSIQFVLIYCLEIIILGIYAFFWQQIIKNVDISIAYANKSTSLIWTMLWAIILFKEKITINNVIGIIIVILGVFLINSDQVREVNPK